MGSTLIAQESYSSLKTSAKSSRSASERSRSLALRLLPPYPLREPLAGAPYPESAEEPPNPESPPNPEDPKLSGDEKDPLGDEADAVLPPLLPPELPPPLPP